MIVKGTNLSMVRGDNEKISVRLEGYTLKLGDKVEFTVRKDVKSDAVIHKEVTSFSDNSAVIEIEPADTEGLNFGDYIYDVQLTYDGLVKTIVRPSRFTVSLEVTYGDLG